MSPLAYADAGMVTPEQRRRVLQRLAARGTLTVKLVVRKSWDAAPDPVWVVYLARRPRQRWQRPRWFYEMVGWDDVRAEDPNLDEALLTVLGASTPSWVRLDEWVFEQRARGVGRSSPVLIGGPCL